MRTSLYLPAPLHQRLVITAKKKETSVSQLVSELLDRILTMEENKQLDQLYEAMNSIKGIGDPNITDASTTINQTLYEKPHEK